MMYLDHNATTPLLPNVREKLLEVAEATPLNPSSAHFAGNEASRVLETARTQLAELVGGRTEHLIFNSGATEGNNVVLAHAAREGAIITSTIEHSSVLVATQELAAAGTPVYYVAPDSDGLIAAESVAEAIDQALANGPVGVVSIQWVNNETGVIQPIEQIAAICESRGVALHSDGAQAVGKIPLELAALPIDFVTLSGHKFHAPSGVGALYARRSFRPLLFGGEQEGGRRAGTENLLGIAALGEAARYRHARFDTVQRQLAELRNRFERTLTERYPWIRVNGAQPRVANTTNLQFGNIDGEALMAQLDVEDIAVSQSSACTNSRPTPSHVLQAMGRSEREAFSAVRFSFGETNTAKEIDEAISRLAPILDRLSALEALG